MFNGGDPVLVEKFDESGRNLFLTFARWIEFAVPVTAEVCGVVNAREVCVQVLYSVKLPARRAVEGDEPDELVPGESSGNGNSAPRDDFVLFDERVARGKQDGDTTLGAAAGTRDCRARKKGSCRESSFPHGSIGRAPVGLLEEDSTPRLEPTPYDALFIGRLVGVR